MLDDVVTIYTDGACSGNPGPGGWGVLLEYKKNKKRLSGFDPGTTNNRMELLAAIEGLSVLSKPSKVLVYTDSKYVQQGITAWIIKWKNSGWKTSSKAQVKNVDLWQQLDSLCELHTVEWCWVKAHAGIEGNEVADSLARQAIVDGVEAS